MGRRKTEETSGRPFRVEAEPLGSRMSFVLHLARLSEPILRTVSLKSLHTTLSFAAENPRLKVKGTPLFTRWNWDGREAARKGLSVVQNLKLQTLHFQNFRARDSES